MSSHYDRAVVLFTLGRADLAEPELRRELASNAGNSLAHSLLGICLARRRRFDEAVAEAEEGLRLNPNLAYSHFAMACVLVRKHAPGSRRYIEEAIRLDPTRSYQFFLLSAIHSDHRRHQESLNQALNGLRLDPDHPGCASLRALALQRLGRWREAEEAILHALSRGPNNDFTHAAQGWRLLAKRSRKQARDAFLEALRINPENRWAQLGLQSARNAGVMHRTAAALLGLSVLLLIFVNTSEMDIQTRSNVNAAVFVTACSIAYVVSAITSKRSPAGRE